jgi:8-amino-7-oxononanoate synthase
VATPVGAGPSFVFGDGLVAARATATVNTVAILQNQPEPPEYIRNRTEEHTVTTAVPGPESGEPAGAVISVVLGPPELAFQGAAARAGHGVRAGCLRPRAVPAGRSCLRLTARANLSSDDLAVIRVALTAVAEMKVKA